MKASILVAVAVLSLSAAGAIEAQSVWLGGTGAWSDSSRWTPAAVPNDWLADVMVDAAKPVNSAVTIDGAFTVGRLSISAMDSVVIGPGGSLTILSGSLSGGGGLINEGTLSFTGGSSPANLIFSGSGSITGNGIIILGDSAQNRIGGANVGSPGSTLLIGAGQTIEGAGQIGDQNLRVTNHGTVRAVGSVPLVLQSGAAFGSSFTNAVDGLLEAAQGGTLEFRTGESGPGNQGVIQAQTGSSVILRYIYGGDLKTFGTGILRSPAGEMNYLFSCRVDGQLVVENGAMLSLESNSYDGATSVHGTVSLQASSSPTSLIVKPGSAPLGGTIQLSDSTMNVLEGSITVPAGSTIEGAGLIRGGNIVNRGVVSATGSVPLVVFPGDILGQSFLNDTTGILEARNGATLELRAGEYGFTNYGIIRALDQSIVRVAEPYTLIAGGVVSTSGTGVIRIASGVVALFQDVTNDGKLVVESGATLRIYGFLVNNGTIEAAPGAVIERFSSEGPITNNGVIRILAGASLDASTATSFDNFGVLDLITGTAQLPATFANGPSGVVLTAADVRIKQITRPNSTGVSVLISANTGHIYRLQKSDGLATAPFVNVGPAQTGETGSVLKFVDSTAAAEAFYRVVLEQ